MEQTAIVAVMYRINNNTNKTNLRIKINEIHCVFGSDNRVMTDPTISFSFFELVFQCRFEIQTCINIANQIRLSSF